MLNRIVHHYRITRQLGQGGMGVVYEAVHEGMGQHAAIKVLAPAIAADQKQVRRFLGEARAISKVDHPGLVRIFDHGQLDGGTVYITMELLRGETLAAWLDARRERGARPTLAEVLELTRQIAATLHAVHGHGIVHRDLKPENVFLVPDPVAARGVRTKLLDFGIAMLLEDGAAERHTTAGLVLGTPAYMAPEQCEGSRVLTEKVDVYALGVMLFEMVAGRPPFQAESRGALMRQHMFKAPPVLGKLAPEAPAPLCALIQAMLDKDPARRPTMEQLAQRLTADDAPRSGRAAALGAAVLLTLTAISAGVAWRWQASQRSPGRALTTAAAPAPLRVSTPPPPVHVAASPPARPALEPSPPPAPKRPEKLARPASRRGERVVRAPSIGPVPAEAPPAPAPVRQDPPPPPEGAAPARSEKGAPTQPAAPKDFTDDDVRPHL